MLGTFVDVEGFRTDRVAPVPCSGRAGGRIDRVPDVEFVAECFGEARCQLGRHDLRNEFAAGASYGTR